jgi:hypothetical protein
MNAPPYKDTIKTITTHYIDGAFVESHGRDVMDIIRPTKRTRDAPSPRPSARSRFTASRLRKSAQRTCAGCMRPPQRASMI